MLWINTEDKMPITRLDINTPIVDVLYSLSEMHLVRDKKYFILACAFVENPDGSFIVEPIETAPDYIKIRTINQINNKGGK
jgi:hypothetical protein